MPCLNLEPSALYQVTSACHSLQALFTQLLNQAALPSIFSPHCSRFFGCWFIVTLVDPKNTSRECASCGFVSAANRKSRSHFLCIKCGHEDHADINAAKTILSRGRRAIALCAT